MEASGPPSLRFFRVLIFSVLVPMSEARKPKVFIVGISGLIGYSLGLHLKRNFLVTGACFNNQVWIPGTQIFPVTLKTTDVLETLIRVQSPDFIIGCAGMSDRRQVEEQPKVSDLVNIMLPVSTAILASRLRAKYVHIGCAEVFDGDRGMYKEDDTDFTFSDAVGKQKITALSFIRAQTLESTTLRLGRVLGPGHPHRQSFFDQIRVKASGRKSFEASKNKSRSYISVASVCQAVEQVLLGEFPSRHRIFHVGGANMTEYELVKSWYGLIGAEEKLVSILENDPKRDLSLISKLMETSYPAWKAESRKALLENLILSLTPGQGAKRWQRALDAF
jgi:dTDP-4-dehydrorhamnose reductase